MSLSKESILVLDSMMEDIFNRLVTQACHLMRCSRKPKVTLSERDLHFALQLAFPPELFLDAAGCAVNAVRKLKSGRPCTPIMEQPQSRDEANQRRNRLNGSIESASASGSGLSIESNLPYDTFSSNLRHHSSAFNDLRSGGSSSMFTSSGEFNSALSSQISPN